MEDGVPEKLSYTGLVKIALFLILFLIGIGCPVMAQNIDPQYIFVRKAPDVCNPSNCSQLWNMTIAERTFTEGIDDIVTKVGTMGTSQRKLGIGVLFYYNRQTYNFTVMQQSLQRLLETVKTREIPVFIALDGFQWWDGRPDLWNFWDPNKPGYNPANRNNVERINGSDPVYTVTKSWRNWGFEFETSPPPNLASRVFIEDSKHRLGVLIPIIVNWYQQLPADKKWLLGGISLGVETDVGGNFYYYKNGVVTGKGQIDTTQLGYAAIDTLGLAGGVTPGNLNEVVKRYHNELDKYAYDLGIPRSKIFNHVGGYDLHPFPVPASTGLIFPTTAGALTDYGQPGWSFYGSVTTNPENFLGLSMALDQAGNTPWASPEWHTFAGNQQEYINALKGSLNWRNNRLINISNWEEIRDKPYALNAVKSVLNEIPACWVTTPTVDVTINGDTATITWQKGVNNDSVYLNVSTIGDFGVGGTLKTVNVANENVIGTNTKVLNNLGEEKYYWTVIADGCGNQRKIADGQFKKVIVVSNDYNSDNLVNLIDFSIWKGKYLVGTETLANFAIWKKEYLK